MTKDRIQFSGLTASFLKSIAIVAMLIDHVAWAFVPTYTLLGTSMHFIGRSCAPIMCYFIAQGYLHTRNIKKYALRLFIFAAISHIPFALFAHRGRLLHPPTSMIFTLFLGLLAVWAWYELKNPILKTLTIVACIYASTFADWPIYAVLFILCFAIFNDNRIKCLIIYSGIVLIKIISSVNTSGFNIYKLIYSLGMFIPVLLLYFYNGQLGYKKDSKIKWLFYIIYPLQFIVIVLIKML